MDYVETEGDSIDKAIENALKLLGVERDKITVDILSEARKGSWASGPRKRASVRRSESPPSTCGRQSCNLPR